jgi:hypothetical protein
MRTTAFGVLLVVAGCSVVLGACSAPEPSGTKRSNGGTSTNKAGPGGDDDGDGKNPASPDNDRIPENGTPSTPTTPTTPTDPGTGGTDDCDPPGATVLGTKLLVDDLATEKGFFTSADGFPQGSWAYDGTAYRQSRIIDAGDTSVFNKDPQVSNVVVEVSAASTEISTTLGTPLRQIFIVMGTMVNAGSLSAVGCGIEVVGGEAVTQKTSIVRLDGPTANVTTTVLQRTNRGAVQVNEEFKMKAKLMAGTLTCDVTIGGATTTATASNLGLLKGSVGFFTRQTKALFKKASICKVK